MRQNVKLGQKVKAIAKNASVDQLIFQTQKIRNESKLSNSQSFHSLMQKRQAPKQFFNENISGLLATFGISLEEINEKKQILTKQININIKNRIQAFYKAQSLQLDVRDERILIPFQSQAYNVLQQNNFEGQFDDFMNQVRDWLVDVIQIVTSVSFNLFKKDQLNGKQVKCFAAKNILLNIKEMFENLDKLSYYRKYHLMKFVNQEFHHIFQSIIKKYPQTSSKGASRRIKSKINKIDNKQNDEYDFLLKNNIKINFKKSGDYSDDIMKVVNKLISFPTDIFHPNNQNEETNFEVFSQVMEYIYQYSSVQNVSQSALEISQLIKRKTEKKSQNNNKNYLDGQSTIFSERLEKRSSISRQITNKNYIIGQKIPNGTPLFSDEQVQGGDFKIHDSSIIRILTKWAEQLKKKLQNAQESIAKRLYKFKTKNGKFINLQMRLRDLLYVQAKQQQKQVNTLMNLIKVHNISMQTSFTQQYSAGKYVKNDMKIGAFATQLNDISEQLIFKYLNKLIHSILQIPRLSAYQIEGQSEKNILESINLLSFKIGDLMRSKYSCSEYEFLKILTLLSEIQSKTPQIIKIIRIKDRLSKKENDVLINIFFMNKIECEMQLSIQGHQNKQQHKYSHFNHFLYQIIRSQLGPISQMANIVGQYDPFIGSCKNKQQRPILLTKYMKKPLLQILLQRFEFKQKQNIVYSAQFPFFCWNCSQFSIVNNPNLMYRDPAEPKTYCNICLKKKYIQDQNLKSFEYIINCSFKNIKKRQFFMSHLQLWKFDDFIRSIENESQQTCNIQSQIPPFGMYMKDKLKKPKLMLYSSAYLELQNSYAITTIQNNKGRLVQKIPFLCDKKKRIQSLRKSFEHILIFKFKQARQTTRNGSLYLTCNKDGCCGQQIQVGRIYAPQQIIQISHGKIIQCSLRNQTSIINLNGIPKAFQRLQKQIENIEKDGNKTAKNLQIINAHQCNLTNVNILTKFTNLIDLNISDNKEIKSLKGIEQCYNLKVLECKNCGLSNLNELNNLKKIQYLNISGNRNIVCMQGLTDHTEILEMFMAHTNIYKLDISNCLKLQYLDIQNCGNIKTLSTINSQKLESINIIDCPNLTNFDLKPQCTKNIKIIRYKKNNKMNLSHKKKYQDQQDQNYQGYKQSSLNYDQIFQIINNFLKNQIKYSKEPTKIERQVNLVDNCGI